MAVPSLTVSLIVILALFADEPKGYIQRVALGILAFVLFGVCLGISPTSRMTGSVRRSSSRFCSASR